MTQHRTQEHTRQGKITQDGGRQDKTQDKTRQDMAKKRNDKTREDKTRQDRTYKKTHSRAQPATTRQDNKKPRQDRKQDNLDKTQQKTLINSFHIKINHINTHFINYVYNHLNNQICSINVGTCFHVYRHYNAYS